MVKKQLETKKHIKKILQSRKQKNMLCRSITLPVTIQLVFKMYKYFEYE
jgi:hypothetical protein